MSVEIIVASSNSDKVQEIRDVLKEFGVQAVGLRKTRARDGSSGAEVTAPLENGNSFEENAKIKARHYAHALGRICLADDSGLEVDALNGAPGIFSARYARQGATRQERDEANNRKLLKELRGIPQDERAGRFVCALCLCDPDGNVLASSRGTLEGRIARSPRGENGFGYDPLLVLEDGRTTAQLTAEEKNARSHRGAAARAIGPQIAAVLERENA